MNDLYLFANGHGGFTRVHTAMHQTAQNILDWLVAVAHGPTREGQEELLAVRGRPPVTMDTGA